MNARLLPWVALVACTGDPAQPPVAPAPVALDAARLRDHTRALTELGPRLSATPAEARAEAVVVERLRAAGLTPRVDDFVWDAWRPGTATLTVGGQSWAVEAHSPSPSTELDAPLVLEGGDLAGAIALFSSDSGSRAEHFLRAAADGAVAFVRISDFLDHDGGPLVEVGHTLEGSTMPGAAVDAVVGDALRAHAGEVATLSIAPDIAFGHTSGNVVARVGPDDPPYRVFVLAHYDSWHPSESAFDNALGVGALLSMAERLAAGPEPVAQVVFVATSGEEQGLQGGFAWAEQHADEISPGDVAITLDVLWSGEGRFTCMATTDDLRARAMAHAEVEGLDPRDGGQPGVASDHFPFVLEGADAVWCGRWPDRHYHTVADTLDALDLREAAAATRSQWALLAEVAGASP